MWGNLAWNEQLGIFMIILGFAYGMYLIIALLIQIRDLEKTNNGFFQLVYRRMIKHG
jgi:hypothetical protein